MNIGVLICIYNNDSDNFFEDMLTSVFSSKLQSGCSLRVYLHIDGGISLEKESIISKFPIYKILRSQNNVGLAKGLNKLIDAIEDECYLFRMDADDIQLPDRFLKQIEFMESRVDIDFSGGSIQEFEGEITNIVQTRIYPTNQDDIIKCITKSSPFAHVTMCFRRDFFEKYGRYPENYPLNEDIAYWLQALQGGAKGANIGVNCVLVRMDGAYSRRSYKKAVNELKVFLNAAIWLRTGYVFPFFRFAFRLFPNYLVKKIYTSKIRVFFLQA